jgi:hypothetical protein
MNCEGFYARCISMYMWMNVIDLSIRLCAHGKPHDRIDVALLQVEGLALVHVQV